MAKLRAAAAAAAVLLALVSALASASGCKGAAGGPGGSGGSATGSSGATATASDYATAENWLSLPATPTKNVDVFYLGDTTYQKPGLTSPQICAIDDAQMRSGAKAKFSLSATAFEPLANVYSPYYRQSSAEVLLMPVAKQAKVIGGEPTADGLAAFDYYIKHYNKGRPFILAGHSQGSNVMVNVLAQYMKANPDVYKRMIAAYVIGYSITPEYLSANPELKFATGKDDTGVIVSYNTVSPDLKGSDPVVLPGALAINPITWTRDEATATAAMSLGGISVDAKTGGAVVDSAGNPVKVAGHADARVDTAKGVVVCSTADPAKLAPGNKMVAQGIYHAYDYPFYFFDIRQNAADRIARYTTTHSAEYQKAYKRGLEAYQYGLPLVVMNKTFLTMTSINVSNNHAFGPVNQFNHARTLNDPNSKAVVAPGSNSLSSIAWLDLTREPQVLHVPEVKDHDFVLALLNPYTEDLMNLGTAHNTKPGEYVICAPSQHNVAIPAGTNRIKVDQTRIWIIGSTQLKGPSDVPNVNRIQDGYTLTPLSKYGTRYTPPAPKHPQTTIKQYSLPSGLDFFDTLGEQLALFPPPAADKPVLARLAEVGIGPGMAPSRDRKLSADTLAGLADAVAAGPEQIAADAKALYLADFRKYNGYFLGGFGRYGTNYRLRAVIAEMGLGAFTSDQAIFAMALTDHDGKPLNGSNRYVLHMPSAPPAGEGWSLTVYTSQGFLIPNALKRYQFNNASPLTRNSDGSVDVYLQSAEPTSAAQRSNWLPVADGQGFEVIMRLMAPKPDQIEGILDGKGWQPPAITRE